MIPKVLLGRDLWFEKCPSSGICRGFFPVGWKERKQVSGTDQLSIPEPLVIWKEI